MPQMLRCNRSKTTADQAEKIEIFFCVSLQLVPTIREGHFSVIGFERKKKTNEEDGVKRWEYLQICKFHKINILNQNYLYSDLNLFKIAFRKSPA